MVRIVTDSVASIPSEVARENDIDVVTLFVNRDGVEYADAELDVDEFYRDIYGMVDNIPTSSQPSQVHLESTFDRIAQQGDELLGVFLGSRMSGTFEAALRAARSVATRHPGFSFRLIDSISNSFDEAWPVLRAAAARQAGATIDQCAAEVARGIESTRFLFVPESLAFLHKGGRIGNAAALLGNLVKIFPVITVADGVSSTFSKVRTHNKALAKMLDKFKEDVEQHGLKNVMVHYIGDKAPAVQWAREQVAPIVGHEVAVRPVSPVIGVHVGPAIGIAYECAAALTGKIAQPVSTLIHSS